MVPPRRWLGASWLLVLLAGTLLPLAHLAFVPHVSCPVDGELAHGVAHTEHLLEQPPSADRQGGRVLRAPVVGSDHGSHCALVLFDGRRGVASSRCGIGRLVPPALTRSRPYEPEPSASSFPLHLLAPKQSPPRSV